MEHNQEHFFLLDSKKSSFIKEHAIIIYSIEYSIDKQTQSINSAQV